MIQRLRAASLVLAGILITGTLWQSLKASQPFLLMLNDFLIAGVLITATVVIYKDSTRRRAMMAAGWGLAAGNFMHSFLTRIVTLSYSGDSMLLTFILGIGTLVAIAGLVISLITPRER